MLKSRDWDRLVWAWKGFRDVTGPPIKQNYTKYVELVNKAAKKEVRRRVHMMPALPASLL